MASSVPFIPAGVDPFVAYQQAIDAIFYRKPTPGFEARLYVLGSLMVISIVLGAVYLILLCTKHIRRGGSRPWIFKTANRGDGKFLVINLWIVGTVFSIITCAMGIFYVVDTGRIYLHHGSQKNTWALRSLMYVPMYIHGYVASAGILQGYTMLAAAKGSTRWRPRTTSIVLAAVGIVLLLLQLAASLWVLLRGQEVWTTYVNISEALQAQTWNGTVDYERLVLLQPLVEDLTQAGNHFTPAVKMTCLVLPILPLSCLVLNLGGLFLARRLHRNILSRSSRLMQLEDNPYSGERSGSLQSPLPPIRRGSVAMSVLRQLTVKDPEDDPSWQLQAQQALELLELRKAEGDLIVASTSIAVCALVALGFAAYLTAFVFSGNYASGNWPSLEIALFTIPWEVTVIYVLSFPLLIFNEVHIRPKSVKAPRSPEQMTAAAMASGFEGYRIRPADTREC